MATFAVLEHLRREPEPAYAEYVALLEEAKRTCPRFVDLASIAGHRALIARRSPAWCTAVLGYPFPGYGPGGISTLEMHLLVLADCRDLDPPLPGIVLRWRSEEALAGSARDRSEQEAHERDARAWEQALADCRVPLQVYSNVAGRRAKHAVREALRHAVPTIAAHSGRPERPRLHPAGRPAVVRDHRPRQHGAARGSAHCPARHLRALSGLHLSHPTGQRSPH